MRTKVSDLSAYQFTSRCSRYVPFSSILRKRLMMVALCSGILSTPYRWEWKSKKSMMIFPVLEELGIGFVAFSPLANGLLSGYYTENDRFDAANDYRASMPQFQKESFGQNKALFTLLDELAEQKHATPAQIPLAWMLCKKPWIVPIPGTRKLCRLKENIGAADIRLSAEEIKDIDAALDAMHMSDVFSGSPVKSKKYEMETR